MKQQMMKGHVSAFVTIVIWGMTFISTKVLLTDFLPIEILCFRFLIGFLALFILSPRRLKTKSFQEEVTFAMAGFTGICLYYLLENIALTYTRASNVGVIISIAPFFTAMLSQLFMKERSMRFTFFAGFLLAMMGIYLISFQGTQLEVNPLGDLLAILASFLWAMYAILSKKITSFSYATIPATKKIFSYGLLWMLPVYVFTGAPIQLDRFLDGVNLCNLLFLGFGASALCFVTWNFSVKTLGPIRTSIYIYLVPVITVISSVLLLHEELTSTAMIGSIFILLGLGISEYQHR